MPTLRQFMYIFPTSHLAGLFRGYFIYSGIQENVEEIEDPEEKDDEALQVHDPEMGFDLVLVSIRVEDLFVSGSLISLGSFHGVNRFTPGQQNSIFDAPSRTRLFKRY